MPRMDVRDRILHEGERPQAEEVHLHQAKVLDITLVELHHVAVGHRRALDRHRVDERQRGDEHSAVVDREMPREVRDRERQLAEEREPRALLLVKDIEKIGEGVGQLPRLLSVRKRSKRRSCWIGSTLVMSSTYATIESAADPLPCAGM